jgi:hypothetical protein
MSITNYIRFVGETNVPASICVVDDSGNIVGISGKERYCVDTDKDRKFAIQVPETFFSNVIGKPFKLKVKAVAKRLDVSGVSGGAPIPMTGIPPMIKFAELSPQPNFNKITLDQTIGTQPAWGTPATEPEVKSGTSKNILKWVLIAVGGALIATGAYFLFRKK